MWGREAGDHLLWRQWAFHGGGGGWLMQNTAKENSEKLGGKFTMSSQVLYSSVIYFCPHPFLDFYADAVFSILAIDSERFFSESEILSTFYALNSRGQCKNHFRSKKQKPS